MDQVQRLITPEYASQNRQLHESDPRYGARAHLRAEFIASLVKEYDAKTLIDYGCGKATLAYGLVQHKRWFGRLTIYNYDPAVPEYAEHPPPADFVVCSDVLEHVEPDCLADVLADLRALTLKAAFWVIGTRPALKNLPDGRNAHLIVEPPDWWLAKLGKDWIFCQTHKTNHELGLVLQPRC